MLKYGVCRNFSYVKDLRLHIYARVTSGVTSPLANDPLTVQKEEIASSHKGGTHGRAHQERSSAGS